MHAPIRHKAWRFCVLLLLATLGACASEPKPPTESIRDGMEATRAAVREVVVEPERRLQLLAHVDELELLLTRQELELREGSHILQELNADPMTQRADFEREIERLTSVRRERLTRALDIHFAMVALTTADEWDEIIAREMEAFEATARLEGM